MYLRAKNNHEITILHATEEDWEGAMALAWRTFSRYDAPIYSTEGCESFIDFISSQSLKKVFLLGRYRMLVAKDGDEIVGLASFRENNHISLLFVDADYHGCGIGRALMSCMEDYLFERDVLPLDNEDEKILDVLYERADGHYITVFAAPNAEEFYKKLGFIRIGEEGIADGITYIPMKKSEKEGV